MVRCRVCSRQRTRRRQVVSRHQATHDHQPRLSTRRLPTSRPLLPAGDAMRQRRIARTAARRGSATDEGPTPPGERGVPSPPGAPGLGGEAPSPGARRPL
eukprot:4791592-Prymnesium_polylepis.1